MFYRCRHAILALLITLLFLPSAWYLGQQWLEDRVIDNYLESRGLLGLPPGKDTAIRIAAQVRHDFNTDESAFKALDYETSPFLRHDTRFLLTHLEGTCGHGTRVVINLLRASGFEDVTRITLYDRYLNPSHALVAVKEGDRSYLVDSINSRPWFTGFLESNDVYVDRFPIMSHVESMSMRRAWVDDLRTRQYDGEWARIFDRFWTYSYDATPLSKIVGAIGLRVQAFSLERPSPFISRLAERPNELMAILSGAMAILLLVPLLRIHARLVSRSAERSPTDSRRPYSVIHPRVRYRRIV